MPAPLYPANIPARPQTLGDYRRLNVQAPAFDPDQPPPSSAIPAAIGDAWNGRTAPVIFPLPQDTASYGGPDTRGFFQKLIDLIFGRRPQQAMPVPPVIPPVQAPAYPQAGPGWAPPAVPIQVAPPLTARPLPANSPQTGSQTPGIQVFFSNTYTTNNAQNQATAQADPNNPDRQLVHLIDSVPAGGTLDGAFFDIGVQDVVEAFVRAKQRGVNVRLVTEHDYYVEKSSGAVRPPIQQLETAGITVIPDDRPGLMHDKFLVVDGGPSGPTVWTGSYNITDGGTYHDNNNALEIQSGALANIYEQEFKKMFEQHNFGTDANGAPHPVSQTVQIGTVQVTPYFSPSTAAQSGAKQAILDELANAHSSVQFMAFSFADPDIGQAMLNKAAAGVKVEGVFETSQAHSRYSTWNQLAPQQANMHGNLDVRQDGNPALMHHKVIIIDDSTLITGSFNFSHNAQNSNDENMLVIHNAPDLVAKYRAEFQRIQAVAKVNPGAPSDGPVDPALQDT